MPLSCTTISTLEELPDELLLLICQYLSSMDVLYSFYELNCRLSRTISGYCQHVVIGQLPYNQFGYLCSSILPQISSNISSLVVSNKWTGVLSQIFLSYFGSQMSLTFPYLKHLTFISFSAESLKMFLDCLQDLSELHELKLCHQYYTTDNSTESETLLYRIFSSNNNRLNSILFDDESIIFSLKDQPSGILYSNIQKLSINVKTINDLHRLLTLLPQLVSINVTINEESSELDQSNEYIPVDTLKECQLRSFGVSWNLDILTSVVKRIPNVKELSIAIESYDDERLIDGRNFVVLPLTFPLKKFSYFIQFYNSSSSINPINIRSTWHEFHQEFICVRNDEKNILALYTLPFVFSYLILASSIAKNEVFMESYASQVKLLTLHDVSTHLVDIFPAIRKFCRVQRLDLRIDKNVIPLVSQQIYLAKLPYLNKILLSRGASINMEYFQRLLEVSPNLYHLEVNYEFIESLLSKDTVSPLFGHRITHVYIRIPVLTSLESITSSLARLTSLFPALKHFYLGLANDDPVSQSIILIILKYLTEWKFLVSFGVVDVIITEEMSAKDMQRWVLENLNLSEHKLFSINYADNVFRLWL